MAVVSSSTCRFFDDESESLEHIFGAYEALMIPRKKHEGTWQVIVIVDTDLYPEIR